MGRCQCASASIAAACSGGAVWRACHTHTLGERSGAVEAGVDGSGPSVENLPAPGVRSTVTDPVTTIMIHSYVNK